MEIFVALVIVTVFVAILGFIVLKQTKKEKHAK